MAWFKRERTPDVTHVDGKRGSVLGTGLGYKRDDLPRAFGELERLSEQEFAAVLKPQQPNEYNRTPIEVWVNGVHIGYVNDRSAPTYWQALSRRNDLVSCDCVVQADTFGGVNRARLSLPAAL